jgi:hypothetical protein
MFLNLPERIVFPMTKIISSGHIGTISYLIEEKDNRVEAKIYTPEEVLTRTLPSWDRAEIWVAKRTNEIRNYETD